jgi:hypothetical protein
MMVRTVRPRRTLSGTLVAIFLYAVVLLLTPGLHHDFACHQNSRSHCTSCLTNQTAPNVDVCPTPIGAMLGIAGQIEARAWVNAQSPALLSDSGRSPPA